MGRYLNNDEEAAYERVMMWGNAVQEAAKEQAAVAASPSGLHLICLALDKDGDTMWDYKYGAPVVFAVPFVLHSADMVTGEVRLAHPEQHVRPEHAASLAGVDKATIHRAIAYGKLAKHKPSERVTLIRLDDLMKWIEGRKHQSPAQYRS